MFVPIPRMRRSFITRDGKDKKDYKFKMEG